MFVGNLCGGESVCGYGIYTRSCIIVAQRCIVEKGVLWFGGWLIMSTVHYLCLCPSLVIRKKFSARSRDHCN